MSIVSALLGALVLGIKLLVARGRPPLTLADEVRVLGPRLYTLSFPSGHTFMVFVILGFLSIFDRRMALGWSVIAVWVAVSRVYLGVHYPSDVIAAAILGLVLSRWMTRAALAHQSKRNISHEPN